MMGVKRVEFKTYYSNLWKKWLWGAFEYRDLFLQVHRAVNKWGGRRKCSVLLLSLILVFPLISGKGCQLKEETGLTGLLTLVWLFSVFS